MDVTTSVAELSLVGPIYLKRLEKLEIENIEELLHHVPHRYLDFSLTSDIGRAQLGETLTVRGQIVSMKNLYTKTGKKIQVAEVSDATGIILAVWFNQPFLVKTLYPGLKVALAGKIEWFGRKRALISPEYEKVFKGRAAVHTGRIIPIYPETSGVSSKWIRGRVKEAFQKVIQNLSEFLPDDILKSLGLPGLKDAIDSVHFPKNLSDAEAGRKRLAFNELLFLQLKNVWRKKDWEKNQATHKLKIQEEPLDKFISSLPFEFTPSQKRSVGEILQDLERGVPMNRLLEGDVGSGKTVVATTAAFASFLNGYQTVFMAPTQILAQQHYETLGKLLDKYKVRISLVISESVKSDLGKTDIFVGTHALIHQKLDFDTEGGDSNVALVVIDEQHRFGVEQRAHLVKKVGRKKIVPHVLTMTATPIPRSVALTFYGDLDLSTLKELPQGRKKITTWVVPPVKREAAYGWIEEKIKKEGIQVFIICPLIEESEKETMQTVAAATKLFLDVKKAFKPLSVGLLHGRQKAKEKNEVLKGFKEKKIHVLVSTPVVEVGIDVANATIMLVEAAERFGLAQLHQLRGRVGRGEKKSYCLLISESKSKKAISRLAAMTKSISGFELAEIDLKLRGPGEVFGTKQSGFPELKIASWQDFSLIRESKKVAEEAFNNPQKFNLLHTYLKEKQIIAN
ncbi:ATP-dependent DNA helicase RecG [Candidatus Woesebacteria bacterium]|nr:ATP-dependent DNA helicase RecG [Candidatus Woesebacteria bacterium]